MDTKLINLAYEVSDEIKAKKDYKRLLELKHYIDNDEVIVNLIEKFNKVKIKYDEVQKYGKYHPDLKKVQLSLVEVKEELYTNKIVVEYKKLEKVIQDELDEVSKRIAKAVSDNIKHPNEIGLIPKH